MTETEKQEMVAHIIDRLHRTAAWRDKMRLRFPADPRNAPAAELLRRLATEVDGLSDSDCLRLERHFALTSQTWADAVGEAARLVGFKTHSSELGSFIRNLIGLLAPSVVSA